MNRAINGGSEARMYQERGDGFSSTELASGTSQPLHSLKSVSKLRTDSFTVRRLMLLVGVIVWTLANQALLLAAQYEVQGTMSYRFTDAATGTNRLEQEAVFSMSVDGPRWFLKKTPTKFVHHGHPRPMEEYTVASSDGTNFYFLVSYGNAAEDHGTNTIVARPRNVASARIGNGNVPYGTDTTIGLLWYALASGYYFQQQVTNEYLVGVSHFSDTKYYANDFRTKAIWELGSRIPHLPTEITFTGEYRFLDDRPDPAFKGQLRATNWVYRVLVSTNAGDLELPLQAMASIPSSDRIKMTFNLTVTNVKNLCSIEHFAPAMPGATVVSDMRTLSPTVPIAVAGGVVKEWPQVEASKSKAALILQNRKVHDTHAGDHPRNVRWWVLSGVFLTSGAFFVFTFYRKFTTQT